MPVDPSCIWAIVTCMGRLRFLRQTLPAFLAEPGLRYCLVDYACPDACGAWAESRFAPELAAGRMTVARVFGQAHFRKCHAQNEGARAAISRGAEFLCFLDADTVVRPGFARWLSDHLANGRFTIAARTAAGKHMRSTGGLLAVSAADFLRLGGYDETFVGWGGEDVEIRLRLFLSGHLAYDELPLDLIGPMSHSDGERGRHCATKNIRESERRNRNIVERKVRLWTGASTANLAPLASRLLMGRIWHSEVPRTVVGRLVRRGWQ